MKIKKHFVKVVQKQTYSRYRRCMVDMYDERWIGRYWTKNYIRDRNVRTFNERRQNHHAECDGIKVRGNRKLIPHSWDDPHVARWGGASWKDYTKRRKQWDK